MWLGVVTIILLGYLGMGRSFAYWGIPRLHVFIGEVVLASFLLFGPRGATTRWPWAATSHPRLRGFLKVSLLFLHFGILQMLRGIFSGHPPLYAVRDLALNYYPLYFFLGLWAGLQEPGYLARVLRFAAWVNGVYGILFILVLSRLPWHFPGVGGEVFPVPLFGQPSFSGAILLGLLSFEKNLGRAWVPLLLNAFVLLGMLIRAEWVAFALALIFWSWFTKKLRRVALGGAVVIGIFGLMYATDFAYEAPETRGGTISAKDVVGRAIAPLNPELAADYTSEVQQFEGNAVWRTSFWAEIWNSVHENSARSLFGHGYGFPLNDLLPELVDPSNRTPHNVFFLILGYTGWLGVLIFGLLQIELARLLWRSCKMSGQAFGIVFWVSMLAFSVFTPFFEIPYGAIPFFLVTGSACAPLFCSVRAAGGAKASAMNPLSRPNARLSPVTGEVSGPVVRPEALAPPLKSAPRTDGLSGRAGALRG